MSYFDKLEYELYAPLSLYFAFPSFVCSLVKGESPDWQDEINSIGIEVVRAENDHIGYTKNIARAYLGKPEEALPVKIKHDFKGELFFNEETKKLFCVSDSKGLIDGNRHINLAISKAEDKLKLLNKPHFCCFKKNCLYMFMTMSLFDNDGAEFFKKYMALAQEYTRDFSDIFLMTFGSIYWFDATTERITRHNLNDTETVNLDDQVHSLRKASNWDNGTRFIEIYNSLIK